MDNSNKYSQGHKDKYIYLDTSRKILSQDLLEQGVRYITDIYKKHLDASVKERPQTLLVPSEQICKRV